MGTAVNGKSINFGAKNIFMEEIKEFLLLGVKGGKGVIGPDGPQELKPILRLLTEPA